MFIKLFSSPSRSRLRVRAGPLALHLNGFADQLATQGYSRYFARLKLATVCDFGAWIEHKGLDVTALDGRCMEAFLQTRELRRSSRHGEAATGRQLLAYLRENGCIPPASPPPNDDSPLDRIVHTYERFLVNERGLSRTTIDCYLPVARAFVSERFGESPIELERLSARDANQFVLGLADRLGTSRCKQAVTALRSFLRHLHQRGDLSADLARAVLPVRQWRLSELPRALTPEQVEALLESCDTRTAVGRRDRAILLLLARLGLRAGEVAALTLDDFDWKAGVVTVPGKGRRRDALPVPSEVGRAVAEYLQAGRPQSPTRHVFVRMRAPRREFHSYHAVTCVVRRALARAGLDGGGGAHLLRHSLATGMLRNGATLEDIGQILRHDQPETTQIYAKVDLEALRAVAPTWPGGAA